ncbi:MAG: sulfotransferase [Phycisphaerales bacterium]|nr:sulfotransferase [Phycisphaerales bacterium]
MAKRPVAQLINEADQATRIGDHAKAVKLLKHAAKDQSNSAEIAVKLADSLVASGQPAEAVKILNRSIQKHKNNAALLSSLVTAQRLAGNLNAALEAAHELTRLSPDSPQSWHLLGRTQMASADAPTAYHTLEHALSLDPDDLEIRGLFADAQLSSGVYPLPIDQAEEMVRLQPDNSRNHSRLGNGYRINTRFEEAIAAFDTAMSLDRHNLEAVAGKAEVLESLGQTDEAMSLVKPRIYTGQTSFLLLNCWARLCQRKKDPATAIGPIEQFISAGRSSAWHRSNLLIRLGQLYEKVERYDEAFQAWTLGNRLHRGRWDNEAHEQLIDRLISAYSEEAMNSLPRSDSKSSQPVFVVGMYRSGTTLTEQILSAHPAIAGAGELGQMNALAIELPEKLGDELTYPECIAKATPSVLAELAESYRAYAHQLAGNEDRITDKMPMNYLHVGLISLVFPNARIIHCTRNPMDTCISCYGNAFSSRMAYTADLNDLGHTYRQYKRLMAHWENVNTLPMIELNYESLVTDPEPVLRSILEFIEIPWDDACLSFHESKRINVTPSIDQVREPLYRGSMGRASHFESHLEPLKQALASG